MKTNPKDIEKINEKIVNCRKCKRLREYCADVAEKKVRRFKDHEYWGKPVPSFGDPTGRILIVGLAPAAHGANRTGRMFTGDSSGDWLFKALYNSRFANQPISVSIDDKLILTDVYITAAVHCAPPGNKPSRSEVKSCSVYLKDELKKMKNLQVVLCLGRLAYNEIAALYDLKRSDFAHGKLQTPDSGPKILCSYHPSRQNTQTGRLKWDEWQQIFNMLNDLG